jgi:hypothetical protein
MGPGQLMGNNMYVPTTAGDTVSVGNNNYAATSMPINQYNSYPQPHQSHRQVYPQQPQQHGRVPMGMQQQPRGPMSNRPPARAAATAAAAAAAAAANGGQPMQGMTLMPPGSTNQSVMRVCVVLLFELRSSHYRFSATEQYDATAASSWQ